MIVSLAYFSIDSKFAFTSPDTLCLAIIINDNIKFVFLFLVYYIMLQRLKIWRERHPIQPRTPNIYQTIARSDGDKGTCWMAAQRIQRTNWSC